MSHHDNPTETNIRNWLNGMGFTITTIPQTDPNLEFNLAIANAFGTGLGINVAKPRNQQVVVTGLAINIDPPHRQGFARLTDRQKSDFIFEIQKNLLLLDMDFIFVPSVMDPQQIQVNRPQFIEDLTRTSLIDSLRATRNAGLYIIWAVNNKFTSQLGPSRPSAIT